MSKLSTLSAAILMALTVSVSGCGDSGGSAPAVVKDPQPAPKKSAPPIPPAPKKEKTPTPVIPPENPRPLQAEFIPHDKGVVQSSALQRVSRERAKFEITSEKGISPQSERQKQLVQEVFQETNRKRKEHGLQPLKYNEDLSAYAQVRAHESAELYKHERPNGEEWYSEISREPGSAAENLYASPKTPKETVEGWMKSEAHRKNILSEELTEVGIGYTYRPESPYKHFWAQTFSSGERTSAYKYDNTLTPEGEIPLTPEVETFLPTQVHFNSGDRLTLNPTKETGNVASQLFAQGSLQDPAYKAANRYNKNGYDSIIQNPQQAGFSYQTFGEVVNRQGVPVQYVNLGRPTVPNEAVNLHATYRGASIGNLDGHSHVYSDVVAKVDFGERKKMDVEFTNTRIAHRDIADRTAEIQLKQAANLDFKEQLQWDKQNGRFSGKTTQAHFYGQGDEIGGQFNRKSAAGQYEGAFGLRRETK